MSAGLLLNEPLASHTSWRVGGTADRYFRPRDRADLLDFIRGLSASEPVLWLGLGSNLLVRDGGFRGTVIALHGALDEIVLESPTCLRAEAGAHCARVAKFAQQQQRAGLGFMAGIPGTVGGALAMNAGAWGGETWPCVREVEIVMRGGETQWLPAQAFRYGYRELHAPPQMLGFLGARFEVGEDADGEHARHMRQSLERRKLTQPVGKPSAGSTFRNPPGDHAARLIEACGLKGYRLGGAQVSTLHANFIITDAGARAAEVETLIEHIKTVVQRQTGVELQAEVRIVGEAS